MINIYKITKPPLKGCFYIMYKNGVAKQILLEFDELLQVDQLMIRQFLALEENQLEMMKPYFAYVLLQPRTVNDKIAAFCMTFQAHRNSAYTPKKNERANVAQVTMSDKLLQVYFTSDSFPLSYAKSINDYIRHYNYIRDIATNGKPVRGSFPEVYDREYERTLEGEKLSAYWQHLIKLGWRKQDGSWTKAKDSPNL